MPGPVLYSTNPWISHDFAMKYLGGKHVVWCSEYYDPTNGPTASAGAAIAPSSNPRGIFERLKHDCDAEDMHSALIKGYKKKFLRLANNWRSAGSITEDQRAEIFTVVKGHSWKIWRPLLYVIPSAPIVSDGRLISVPAGSRAAYGPECQIRDLMPHEFDLIECVIR